MDSELTGMLTFIGMYIVVSILPATIYAIRTWKSGKKGRAILIFASGAVLVLGLVYWALIIGAFFEKRQNERFVKVFVPRSKRMYFPQVCVHCLNPSEEKRQLEWSISNTQQTGLRTTTTTTTTSKIAGIPYCHQCANLSDKIKKTMRRLLLISVLAFLVVLILSVVISGDRIYGDAVFAIISIPIAVVLILQLAVRIYLRTQHPEMKRLHGGKNHILSLSMKFADEKAPSQGVYLTFDNMTYGQKFAMSNNLPIGNIKKT